MPPITIYTKGWCPYCSAAKKLLDDKGATYTELKIAQATNGAWSAQCIVDV